jgi:hypothetical protein
MKRRYYYFAFALSGLLSAFMISGFFRGERASATEAPLSEGYEVALKTVKPIFRPKGTAPAVWGPGDL